MTLNPIKTMRLLVAITHFTVCVFANEMVATKVAGSDSAELSLIFSQMPRQVPNPHFGDDTVDFLVPEATLHKSLGGMVDMKAPHALISRMIVIAEKEGVRVRLALAPGLSDLRKAVVLSKSDQALLVNIRHPEKTTATLELLKEEQKPLAEVAALTPAVAQPEQAKPQRSQTALVFLSVLVVVGIGGAGYFGIRFLKGKHRLSGKRKHLIEQLSYCSFGPKSGVSLIRIGKEFVLVGITPSQITYLSSVPQLAADYVEESKLERETFRQAVEKEVVKMNRTVRHMARLDEKTA